jgi:hypothetical protein
MIFFSNDNNDFKAVIFLIILLGPFIKVFTVFNFRIQIKFMIFFSNNNNNSNSINGGSGGGRNSRGGIKKNNIIDNNNNNN